MRAEHFELFGGKLFAKREAQQRLLALAGQQTALDRADLEFVLSRLLELAPRRRTLEWNGDHTVAGDWEVDSNQEWVRHNGIAALVCFGHLTIEGDLLNFDGERWPLLIVTGDLRVRNVVKGGMPLIVLGNLLATGYFVAAHEGILRVGGDLAAAGYIPCRREDPEAKTDVIAGAIRARTFDLGEPGLDRGHLRAAFVPEVLMDGWLEAHLVREREGLPVFRDPSEPPPPPLEIPQPPPLPQIAGVDPVGLGTLSPAREVQPRLIGRIEADIPHDPEASSYPEMFARGVRDSLEGCPDSPVLVLPPGTRLAGDLELDWDAAWVRRHGIVGVVCEGDLTVDGDVLNRDSDSGPLLFVGGRLHVGNLLAGGSRVVLLGGVDASGLVIGFYNHGSLLVRGDLRAQALIWPGHHGYVLGETHGPTLGDLDDPRALLVPEVFEDPYEDRPTPNEEWLWARQRAGLPVLKPRE